MTILWILLKVTGLMAFGLTAVRLARRRSASVRHILLTATFLGPLLVPFLSFVGPTLCVIVPAGLTVPPPNHQPGALVVATPVPTDLAASPRTVDASPSAMSWRPWLLAIWLSGATLFCWPVLAGSLRIRSLRRSSLAWPGGERFSPRGKTDVLLHEFVHGPITWGVLRPIVVLPAEARTWSAEDVERALTHEFEHIRRHDWLTQRVARIVCAVYWFHPLMWIAWHALTLEAERACDDAVISRDEAAAYAEQLLRLAERQAASGRQAPLLAMTGRHDLATRIRAILDRRQPRGRAGVVASTLICLTATVLVAASAPIRFVPITPIPVTANPPGFRKEVRMPKRTLPGALAVAITSVLSAPTQSVRAQEPVFNVNYNVNYAADNGLTAESDEDFIKHAVRLCAIEIQAGKLAMTKTSNAEVKAFAERLVNDHTATAQALTQWATKKNVVLKADDPNLKMRLDRHKALEMMTGADFDRAFVTAIMTDQVDGITLVNNERRNSPDVGLSALAEETRLTLIAHMNVARPLRAKLF